MTQKTKRVDKNGRKLPDGYSQRKDGRYQARFTHRGKRYTLYDIDLANLKIKVTDKQNALNKGLYSDKGNITLNQWFSIWMETYKLNLKNETRINYYKYWSWYIERSIGKSKIKDIRRSDIIKLYNDLILGEKKLSTGTIKYINNMINSSLLKAVDEDIIYKNPSTSILKEIVKTDSKNKDALSPEQQIVFLKYIKNSNYYSRFEAMFVVLLGTGMRVGELSALTWDCVDFDNEIIIINKTLKYLRDKTDEGLYYDINTVKTSASERQVPMIREVKAAFMKQKDYQRALGSKSKIKVRGYSEFVFTTGRNKPIYPDYVNLVIKRIVKTYNQDEKVKAIKENREVSLFPVFSPHTTRHTFASRCYDADVKAKTAQLVMGHKNIETTLNIYTKCSEEKLKKDINQLSTSKIFG